MTVELRKHTCVSCAYLCEEADKYIRMFGRERALDDKKWNNGNINYLNCVCSKGKLQNFQDSGKTPEEIRDEVISPNPCKQWAQFINGISPIATEQRESAKWARRAFLIALASLVAILITWILTQFILA